MIKKILSPTMLLLLFILGAGRAWAVSAGDVFVRISSASDLSDGDEIIFVNQSENYACGTTQNTNNRTPVGINTSNHTYTYAPKDNVQVFVVRINANGKFGFHTGSGYIYSASSDNNYLKTNTTKVSYSPSDTYAWTISVSNYVCTVKNGSNTSYYLAFNGTDYFTQYKLGQSKPYIYKKQVVTSVNINEACTDGEGKFYGTYSNSSAFVVPEGLTVSEINVNAGVLIVKNYATGAIVPANTGVMVSASTSGDKTLVLSDETGTSVLGNDNKLRASSVAMNDAGYEYFRLTMHMGTTIGYFWGADGGASFSIAANKAYLAVPSSEVHGVKGFALFDDEKETAIEYVEEKDETVAAYNLMGQRVRHDARGLVIVNGKKYFNK